MELKHRACLKNIGIDGELIHYNFSKHRFDLCIEPISIFIDRSNPIIGVPFKKETDPSFYR